MTVQCLTNTSTVSVQCPANYDLRIGATAVYKSASGCPSTRATDACWHSNVTELVSTTCSSDSSCLLTLPEITSPLHCSLTTYPGDYFAAVDYRCYPGLSLYSSAILNIFFIQTPSEDTLLSSSLPILKFYLTVTGGKYFGINHDNSCFAR